jgi:hypothetical protein
VIPVLGVAFWVLLGAAAADWVATFIADRRAVAPWHSWALLAGANAVDVIRKIITGDMGGAVIAVLIMVWCAIMARSSWRRRKRRNVLAALGAKSLARLAALVRRAREAARPRPVLRPQPGGVR